MGGKGLWAFRDAMEAVDALHGPVRGVERRNILLFIFQRKKGRRWARPRGSSLGALRALAKWAGSEVAVMGGACAVCVVG